MVSGGASKAQQSVSPGLAGRERVFSLPLSDDVAEPSSDLSDDFVDLERL
jgi:hypothetical protein